jgi:hypothetical protein
MARYLILALLFSSSLFGQEISKDRDGLAYVERVKVPRSGRITVNYGDLYPDMRFDFTQKVWMIGNAVVGPSGGCTFQDVTNSKSWMPILEDAPDHVTLRAPRGHIIEYHCNWNVPKK